MGATTRKAAPAAGESPNIFLTCSSDVLAALCSEPQPLSVRRKGSLSLEDFSEGLDSPPLLPMNASLASLEPVIEQLPPWSREKSQEYFFPLDGSRRPAPPPALSPEPVREPCVPKPCEPFSDSQSGLRVKSEPIAPSLPAFQAVAAEAGGYETGEAVQPEGAKGAEGAEVPSGAALAEPVMAASPHCAPTVASPRKACPLGGPPVASPPRAAAEARPHEARSEARGEGHGEGHVLTPEHTAHPAANAAGRAAVPLAQVHSPHLSPHLHPHSATAVPAAAAHGGGDSPSDYGVSMLGASATAAALRMGHGVGLSAAAPAPAAVPTAVPVAVAAAAAATAAAATTAPRARESTSRAAAAGVATSEAGGARKRESGRRGAGVKGAAAAEARHEEESGEGLGDEDGEGGEDEDEGEGDGEDEGEGEGWGGGDEDEAGDEAVREAVRREMALVRMTQHAVAQQARPPHHHLPLHTPCTHPARTLHTPSTHPPHILHTPSTHPAPLFACHPLPSPVPSPREPFSSPRPRSLPQPELRCPHTPLPHTHPPAHLRRGSPSRCSALGSAPSRCGRRAKTRRWWSVPSWSAGSVPGSMLRGVPACRRLRAEPRRAWQRPPSGLRSMRGP